jgi:hypothetical protein
MLGKAAGVAAVAVIAIKKFADVMDGLVEKFAKYNPQLMGELRMYQRNVRMLNIQTARQLAPALTQWLKLKVQLLGMLGSLAPALAVLVKWWTVLGGVLKFLIPVVSKVATVFGYALFAVGKFASILLRFYDWLSALLIPFIPALEIEKKVMEAIIGKKVSEMADEVGKLADEGYEAAKGKPERVQGPLWNGDFLRKLSGEKSEPGESWIKKILKPAAPAAKADQSAAAPSDTSAAIDTPKAPEYQAPQPVKPQFDTHVQQTLQVSVAHEQQVWQMLMQARDKLIALIQGQRDEAAMAAEHMQAGVVARML